MHKTTLSWKPWGYGGPNITAGEAGMQLQQLYPYLATFDLATWIYTIVISSLDYCDVLSIGLHSTSTWKLQVVQNMMHSIPILQTLHWLPLSYQTQFKVFVVTYQALHSFNPSYLWNWLSRCDLPKSFTHSSMAFCRCQPSNGQNQ